MSQKEIPLLSTAQLRTEWAPRCTGPWVRVPLNGAGSVQVRVTIKDAVLALNRVLAKWGYKTRSADTGAYNCLAGDTLVVTRDGWVPISELAGSIVELLTAVPGQGGPGRWVNAPISSFGKQKLYKITIGKHGIERTIRATADHRWFVRGYDGPLKEVTTLDLQPRDGQSGHRLASLKPQSVASRTIPSDIGIMAGLVYGDGTVTQYGGRAFLANGEKETLEVYFPPGLPRWENEHGVIVSGLPTSWKNAAPEMSEGTNVVYGWIAGYFAADGRVSKDGAIELSSADRERLEVVRTRALQLGIGTTAITSVMRTGFGTEPTPLYSLRFDARSLDESFFLLPHHRERFSKDIKRAADWSILSVEEDGEEEVYCATVEDTEAFVIDEFILTGNCRKISGSALYSLHAYGIALDINWNTNPYSSRLKTDMPIGMVNEILAIRTNNGQQVWRWGGNFSSYKDAMHFEVACSPRDIATGIRGGTVAASPEVNLAALAKSIAAARAQVLVTGSRGEAVRWLQLFINQKTGRGLSVDGAFGAKTAQAVKDLRKILGLPISDRVDATIWGFLIDGKIPPPPSQNTTLVAMAAAIANAKKQVLRQGSKGDAVKWLQLGINNISGRGLTVDGAFGPATDRAVRDLQKWFGLAVDGIVGPKTWQLIYP